MSLPIKFLITIKICIFEFLFKKYYLIVKKFYQQKRKKQIYFIKISQKNHQN